MGSKWAYQLGAKRRLFVFTDTNTMRKEPPENYQESFLDSGAFSVFTGKAKIDVHQYGEWLKTGARRFTVYANLDVIGNPEATQRNQIILEQMGLNPLPTWHISSDPKHLQELVRKYDYIGIGGMVGVPRVTRDARMRVAFKIREEEGKHNKFHGWGMTDFTLLKKYPFYSVDSTSWLGAFRFGRLPYDKKGHIIQMKKNYVGLKVGGKASADLLNQYTIRFYQGFIEKYGCEITDIQE